MTENKKNPTELRKLFREIALKIKERAMVGPEYDEEDLYSEEAGSEAKESKKAKAER